MNHIRQHIPDLLLTNEIVVINIPIRICHEESRVGNSDAGFTCCEGLLTEITEPLLRSGETGGEAWIFGQWPAAWCGLYVAHLPINLVGGFRWGGINPVGGWIVEMAAASGSGPHLISVIIPSYNRYKYMLNAVNSVLAQTYKHLEVIVVNDSSTDEHYYIHEFSDPRVRIIHLATVESSRAVCGFPCAGYVRTVGMKAAAAGADYFAFLDDDDCWLPHKLETQLAAMAETGARASCTEGLVGNGQMAACETQISSPSISASSQGQVL